MGKSSHLTRYRYCPKTTTWPPVDMLDSRSKRNAHILFTNVCNPIGYDTRRREIHTIKILPHPEASSHIFGLLTGSEDGTIICHLYTTSQSGRASRRFRGGNPYRRHGGSFLMSFPRTCWWWPRIVASNHRLTSSFLLVPRRLSWHGELNGCRTSIVIYHQRSIHGKLKPLLAAMGRMDKRDVSRHGTRRNQ